MKKITAQAIIYSTDKDSNLTIRNFGELILLNKYTYQEVNINKHIHITNLNNLKKLDKINFDKVIFLIGSSNHHIINKNINIGIEYNFNPMIKIMEYLKNKKIKKFICFTTILLYKKKSNRRVSEKDEINPYENNYIFSKHLLEEVVNFYKNKIPSIIVRLSNIYGYSKLIRPDLVPTLMQKVFKKKRLRFS